MDPDVLANTKAIREYEMATNRQEWSERVERLFQPLEWVQGWDGAIVPDEKLLNIHGLLETLHDPNEPITQDERDDLYAALEALIALRSRVSLLERERDAYKEDGALVVGWHNALQAELAELRTKYEEARRASLEGLLDEMYAAERNFRISAFWDEGIRVAIDYGQSCEAEGYVYTAREAGEWLRVRFSSLGTPEGTDEKQ